MALYLDTEFNGFGGALISIALVSDMGGKNSEFYGVRHLPSKIHPWVAEHVVPFIVQEPDDDHVLKSRLAQFLRYHEGEPIIADWPEDFVHLLYCLCEPNGVSQRIELDMRLIESGEIKPEIPHNALSDARALMHWHIANREAA
jgi:hypothetical protein